MPSKPLTPNARVKQRDAAIIAILDRYTGVVQRDDVGPLFGQLSTLCTATRADSLTRRYWTTAVSVALAADSRSMRLGDRTSRTLAGVGSLPRMAASREPHLIAMRAQKRSRSARRQAR
ncbi:MAG: hypothetical protein ABJC33_07650 [Betaproteobacteria bacterium]